MPTNLTNLGRRFSPTRTDYFSVASPKWDMAEVYNFNPVLERVKEENLNAFRKPQLNASPDIINITEWIGWTIAPATQEQMIQNRMAEARSKIVGVLDFMLKWWQINTKAGVNLAKNLIDLYKKLK